MSDRFESDLPEDVLAEASLLATLCAPGMEARAHDVIAKLDPRDFVSPRHRDLFVALRELLQAGHEVHALTLRDRLEAKGTLGAIGGFSGLTELMASEEMGRPEVLAGILLRKSSLRRLAVLGARLHREACQDGAEPMALSRYLGGMVMTESGFDRGNKAPARAGEAFRRAAAASHASDGPGVPLPMAGLQSILGGLHAGNLTVIGGRPGQGKTSLALQIALHASRRGVRTGFWSLEMSEAETVDRLSAIMGSLTPGWSRRRLGNIEFGKTDAVAAELDALPLSVCDDAMVTPSMIRAYAASCVAKADRLGLVIVDYLQLMGDDDPERARKMNEASRVGMQSRALKLLAKDFGIPVVVLSQLNREVEGQGRPPRLSDLRDSGAIEQDADQVVFPFRKWKDGSLDLLGELVIPKNRHGGTRNLPICWDPERLAFTEVDRETAPPTQAALAGDDWGS